MPWLCAWCADLPLAALALPPAEPAAVYEQTGSRQWLHAVNAAAAQRGLTPGLPLPAALARVPGLLTRRRRPAAERAALEGLALWAYRFGTPVTLCAQRQAAWVRIGPSAAAFGGWAGLIGAIGADQPPQPVHFGIAPTLAASLLLARAGAGLGRPVRAVHEILAAIGRLPLSLLPLEEAALRLLTDAGLRRIGEVLAIAPAALGQRLGPEAVLALERLCGRAPEAVSAFTPPARYRRRLEFDQPVDSREALLFPLRMLLGEFAAYLRARDRAVQTFTLRFADSRRRVTAHVIGLLAPTRDAARLLRVLRERLERLELPDGVLELTLAADRFEPPPVQQDDLFGADARLRERLLELRERLAARLGEAALRQIAVSPDRLPEHAMTTSEQPGVGDRNAVAGTHHPPRPPWLLATPQRLTPARLLGPPERIEAGWWQGAAGRDYFLAEDDAGRLCWVYRDLRDGAFYLHGLWQ
ncbi:DNA polymerase Y family protein [Immundisolibacter sp.]|uniref:Y-family DNA polymerase n=1 Tax=Immundisolibacter sp. TaxID=1934948 RepID=UPI00261F249A|nr:DNA polymerase Y family protein [Immundisolibacter sp.]MDD3650445.1 DNA polymerase Y family protein [Immundisolibacter sp.]